MAIQNQEVKILLKNYPWYISTKESKPLVEKVCNHPSFLLHGHA
jgi:hypothetical protein